MTEDFRYPELLAEGDTIRVVSPAGPVDQADLQIGVLGLEEMGFNVETGRHVYAKSDFLAGNDEDRLSDLITALTEPHIKGVICSRGGYGIVRILERVPWQKLKELPPKVFVGFSDITAFQINLLLRSG